MWSSNKRAAIILCFLGSLIFSACTSPTSQEPKGTAHFTLNLPGYDLGLMLKESLMTASGQNEATPRALPSSSRMLFNVSRLALTLYDSAGEIADTLDYEMDLNVSPGMLEGTLIGSPGSGYTVKAEIYSKYISSTVPVVTGVSLPFSIEPGKLTPVTITCVPLNPLELTPGGETYDLDLIPGKIGDMFSIIPGEERWFRFQGNGSMMTLLIELEDLSRPGAFLQVYDSQGSSLDYFSPFETRGILRQKNELSIPTALDETYYILACSMKVSGMFFGEEIYNGPFRLSLAADLVEAAALETSEGAEDLHNTCLNAYEAFVPWDETTVTFQLTAKNPAATFTSQGTPDADGIFSVALTSRKTEATFQVTSPDGETDTVSLTVHKLQPLVLGVQTTVDLKGQDPSYGILPVTPASGYKFTWDDAYEGSGSYTADVEVSLFTEAMEILPAYSWADSAFLTPMTVTTPGTGTAVILRFTKKGNSLSDGTVGFKADLAP